MEEVIRPATIQDLKELSESIDWSQVPEENRVDWENDTIDVIKAKLYTVVGEGRI